MFKLNDKINTYCFDYQVLIKYTYLSLYLIDRYIYKTYHFQGLPKFHYSGKTDINTYDVKILNPRLTRELIGK